MCLVQTCIEFVNQEITCVLKGVCSFVLILQKKVSSFYFINCVLGKACDIVIINFVAEHPYRTAPSPGQLSSSTYMSDGECLWASSLKSCLRLSVELITDTSSDSFSTRLSMSSCSVPKTGQEDIQTTSIHFICIFYITFETKFNSCFNV